MGHGYPLVGILLALFTALDLIVTNALAKFMEGLSSCTGTLYVSLLAAAKGKKD